MNAAVRAAPAQPGRVGHGKAFGAVSLLNATVDGQGASLAVAGGAQVAWEWTTDSILRAETDGADDRLVRAVWLLLADRLPDCTGSGARVRTQAAMPPARGLKTSSSVAAALVRAASDGAGATLAEEEVERLAVQASRAAGVTLTGAFDDQVAVCRGGAWLTDNAALRVLARLPVRPWHVALWVPDARIAKSEAARVDVAPLRAHAGRIAFLLRAGRLPEALTANGRMMHAAYARAGLPVTDEPVRVALASGALGAGLSGTGPAVAALFDAPCDVPAVAGGSWRWTRVVEAA